MALKQETKSPPSISVFRTRAGSTMAISAIGDLLNLAEAETFAVRYAEKPVSTLRRNQLTGSDVLLHAIDPACRIYRQNGRPKLADDPRRISISHTGGHLAMIIGADTVAIDIEPTERSVRHIEYKFVTARDLEVARSAFPANPGLLTWCIKECLFKYACTEGVDFLRQLELVEAEGNDSVACVIDHPSVKAYLCVRFMTFNHLLIAYIG